jgi:hypothetical protein
MWKIQSVIPVNDTDSEDGNSGITNDVKASVKYTAKPSFQQLPHTGNIKF